MRTTREVADRAEMTKDPYGSASSSHDDEMAAITVDRLARDLKLIDGALSDYDAGRYGVCTECEEPIAAKRLKALPFATRCVECQARTSGSSGAADATEDRDRRTRGLTGPQLTSRDRRRRRRPDYRTATVACAADLPCDRPGAGRNTAATGSDDPRSTVS